MEQEKDSSTLVLGVLGALLLVVGGGWLFLSLGKSPPPPQAVATPDPVVLPDEDIDPQFDLEQNLDMGQMALSAGQLVEPTEGSALYFFLSALAQDSENAEAQLGLRNISDQIAAQARGQLEREEYAALDQSFRILRRINIADANLLALGDELTARIDEKVLAVEGAIRRRQWEPAQALLDQIKTIPGMDLLMTLELEAGLQEAQALATEVAAEQAQEAAAQAAAAAAADAQAGEGDAEAEGESAEASADDTSTDEDFRTQLLGQLRESIAGGRLLQPTDESAAFFLAELERVAPDDPGIAQGRAELVSALVARGLARGQSGNFSAANTAFEAAASYAPNSAALAAARNALQDRQRAVESARVIPVGEMVVVESASPRYPSRALRNDAEGYVVLHFTVLADGTTSDIETIEASDRYGEQFGRAASAAVARWEFEPREYLGEVISQRVEARVTFALAP